MIAHKNENQEQKIIEHLKGTAEQAKKFVSSFMIKGSREYAYEVGLMHDIGKYSELFQKKICGNPNIQVDHSTAGAVEMIKNRMPTGAFCIAGHHAGIPNGKDYTESSLMQRTKNIQKLEDYSKYKEDIPELKQIEEPYLDGFSRAFFIRMMFSALVDADFLDTEKFMTEFKVKRGGYDSVEVLYERLHKEIEPWLQNGDKEEINQIRTNILKQCIDEAKSARGLYSLTVPTGGGKTISSLAFALRHAVENHMDRIIYVIPYTSIIEQNAKVFREKLGKENVVEHHANAMNGEDDENNSLSVMHKLSTENWDAPIIVTTSVQFFESLFSNKVSSCRKLHNIANSVIIFDEAQMIPLSCLKPCVKAIEELVVNYNATAVLCTATQPALNRWFERLQIKEICEEYETNFMKLKRTEIISMGRMTKEEIAEKMCEKKQILVIVNKKKTAQEIYQSLPKEGAYHLSTYMTPSHRRRTIEKIKERLDGEQMVRVVSTSLIEAGVDVDFPCVLREIAGIDSIVQAAGRCNREGKRSLEESQVGVFELLEENHRLIEKNIGMTRETIDKYSCYDSLEAIKYYFQALQKLDETALDQYRVLEAFRTELDGIKMPFKEIGKRFHLIDSQTKMVIIPIEDEAAKLVEELDYYKQEGYNFRTVLRKLGQYSVNVHEYEYKALMEAGHIYEVLDGIAVLQMLEVYREDMGLYEEGGALII